MKVGVLFPSNISCVFVYSVGVMFFCFFTFFVVFSLFKFHVVGKRGMRYIIYICTKSNEVERITWL